LTVKPRVALEALQGHSKKVLAQMPLLHRAVAGAMLQNLFGIIEALLAENARTHERLRDLEREVMGAPRLNHEGE